MNGRGEEAIPKRKLHFGYLVVSALVLTSFVPLSLGISCSGLFYPPIAELLGIEKGMASYYISVLWIASMVSLPFTGKLLNGKDARLCLSLAVGVMAVAFVWLSFTRTLWQFYVGGFLMGIGVGVLLFLAPSTLVNRWFAKRAGFYLGVIMAFTGIGGVVWSTVGGVLIATIGWSATYLVFAAMTACVIPAVLLMVASWPEDKGLEPWGAETGASSEAEAEDSQRANRAHTEGVPTSRAFRMPVFYLLAVLGFFLNFGMYVYIMIPSYATTLEIGVAFPLLGATAGSVAMAGQTVSKLAMGAVGERHPIGGMAVTLGCGIVGLTLFSFATGSVAGYYAAALGFGFYYGVTNVMMPILARRCFGNLDYATIYSRISVVASISNVVGAFFWARSSISPVRMSQCLQG